MSPTGTWTFFCFTAPPGCHKETTWSLTVTSAQCPSFTPSIWRNKALSASSTSIQTTTCCLSSLWVERTCSLFIFVLHSFLIQVIGSRRWILVCCCISESSMSSTEQTDGQSCPCVHVQSKYGGCKTQIDHRARRFSLCLSTAFQIQNDQCQEMDQSSDKKWLKLTNHGEWATHTVRVAGYFPSFGGNKNRRQSGWRLWLPSAIFYPS